MYCLDCLNEGKQNKQVFLFIREKSNPRVLGNLEMSLETLTLFAPGDSECTVLLLFAVDLASPK